MTTKSAKPESGDPVARERLEREVWRKLGVLWMGQRPRLMAVCREYDLHPPQLMVLRLIERPKPMSDVAREMACDSSNLTGITDRLEERGLVRRTASESDRRVKLLVLTEAGEKLRGEMINLMSTPPESVARLGDEELERLDAALDLLHDRPA